MNEDLHYMSVIYGSPLHASRSDTVYIVLQKMSRINELCKAITLMLVEILRTVTTTHRKAINSVYIRLFSLWISNGEVI